MTTNNIVERLDLGGYTWIRSSGQDYGTMFNSADEIIADGFPYKDAVKLLTPSYVVTTLTDIPTVASAESVAQGISNLIEDAAGAVVIADLTALIQQYGDAREQSVKERWIGICEGKDVVIKQLEEAAMRPVSAAESGLRDLFQLMDDECLDLVTESHAIADTGDYDGVWVVYQRFTYPEQRKQIAVGETALEAMQNAAMALAHPTGNDGGQG